MIWALRNLGIFAGCVSLGVVLSLAAMELGELIARLW